MSTADWLRAELLKLARAAIWSLQAGPPGDCESGDRDFEIAGEVVLGEAIRGKPALRPGLASDRRIWLTLEIYNFRRRGDVRGGAKQIRKIGFARPSTACDSKLEQRHGMAAQRADLLQPRRVGPKATAWLLQAG